MFLEELEDLKNRYPGRFHLVHVLSREEQDVDLFRGRLDPERLERILDVDAAGRDASTSGTSAARSRWSTGAERLLTDRGADPRHVHLELFHVGDETAARRPREVVVAADASGGDGHGEPGRPDHRGRHARSGDETILAATLRVRPDAPYACTGGVCGTCRARLVKGEVRMDRNYALEPEEMAGDWSWPASPTRSATRSTSTTTREPLPRGQTGDRRSEEGGGCDGLAGCGHARSGSR